MVYTVGWHAEPVVWAWWPVIVATIDQYSLIEQSLILSWLLKRVLVISTLEPDIRINPTLLQCMGGSNFTYMHSNRFLTHCFDKNQSFGVEVS